MFITNRIAAPFALAAVTTCFSSIVAFAAEPPAAIAAAVDAAFRPLLEQHGVPGIAVGVTMDGQQYFFNYGVAAKDTGALVTENTLFELGSVSKTFTATLGAYAEALDRLELDDHPSKYLPALEGAAVDEASLLHLATYTAGGLPLQFPNGAGGMESYFQQWRADAAPGEQRRYSNPSIGLFGHLTALALNDDFGHLMETEMFPRLGLEDSHITVPEAAMARYAWGYNKDGKPTRVNPGWLAAEAYGVKSSTADMLRFVEANIAPDSLVPLVQRAVEGTHIGYFRVGEMVQGLGWEQYPFPVSLERLLAGNSQTMAMEPNPAEALAPPAAPEGPALFNKTGSTNGFGAYVAFVPDKKIGVVMLANKNFPIPARITATHAVLEQLAEAAD
ncbi:Beta-lactamase precursor [Devosia sp. LC5]|uniref:class C beta-lactamase n=1 Tax=Devosia sp. LC5 TaxID=1502724 RepID=UPI0004E42036|nr:class C beta-lactamase [Devosia sp. LC5]KFC72521.1 Beta-lactamase precursor [Devosia sp. LC5]